MAAEVVGARRNEQAEDGTEGGTARAFAVPEVVLRADGDRRIYVGPADSHSRIGRARPGIAVGLNAAFPHRVDPKSEKGGDKEPVLGRAAVAAKLLLNADLDLEPPRPDDRAAVRDSRP